MNKEDLILLYKNTVFPMEEDALLADASGQRAKGGYLRAEKGELVETMAKHAIEIAWTEAGGDRNRLTFGNGKTFRINIRREYVLDLSDDIRAYVMGNIDKHHYKAKIDVKVFVDKSLVLAIECKAFTENAMLKRILFDYRMLKTIYPDLVCCLFQLESQMGGTYSNPTTKPQYGSPSSHTLMSYFPEVSLNIITLLEGERHPKRPIHNPKYYKELHIGNLDHAIGQLRDLLSPFV